MAEPIVMERVISATPEEAFALFSEPERLRRWFALTASVDATVGGDVRIAPVAGSINRGSITELDPGRRFVWTWGWEGQDPGPGSSMVAVDFEPHDDGTLVRLTHSGLPGDQVPGHTDGWVHYLGRLETAAAEGDAGIDGFGTGIDEYDHLSAAEASWAWCSHVMYGFTSDDRDKPTPCAEYTVHELAEHLMGSIRSLGGMAGAEIPEEIEAGSAEDWMAQAVEPCLTAWRARGLDGELPFGDGTAPATMPAGILSLEFLIHAWDFAQATGQTIDPPAALVDYVQGIAEATIRPEYRGPDKGFAEIADAPDADALERLMAFTGRGI